MKMKLKKILAVLMSAAVLLTFSSCSDQSAAPDSSTVDTSAPETDVGSSDDVSSDSGDRKVYIEGTNFFVNGKQIWFNGVNTPWDNWNDFGGNFEYDFWDSHFAQLKEAGVNATRIWINCNGLVGVMINEDGSFASVTDKHWSDLDSLFELAEKHGIYIMATLLSFDHFKDSNQGYENWRNLIKSSDNIDRFVDGYVIPFAERYDDNDYLFSIDLMNEPDWVYENEECGKQSWDDISDLFARCAAGIHEHSDILVTVGMGIVKYNSDSYEGNKVSDEYLQSLSGNENSYLDFYSPHYYEWQKQWFGYPFNISPEKYKLDVTKPVVIGECVARDDKDPLAQRYENAYNNGWNGVFAWTSNGIDNCGGFDDVKPAAQHMLELAVDKIYPFE